MIDLRKNCMMDGDLLTRLSFEIPHVYSKETQCKAIWLTEELGLHVKELPLRFIKYGFQVY